MNLFNIIGQIFKPAAELIDNLHTSDEERLSLKAQNLETYANALTMALSYENEQLKVRASIVEAEAKSEHWITSAWRPITMLIFVALVVCDSFGWLASPLAEEAWTLLQLGLGGYVVGRSAEKVGPSIIKALKAKDEI
jgi:hypothetical protein